MDPNYIPYTKSVGEAKRGDSAYGTNDYAKSTLLDANSPIQGGAASIGLGNYADVPTTPSSTTGPKGEVETTASQENLSAKYKYPQKSQDTVPQDTLTK